MLEGDRAGVLGVGARAGKNKGVGVAFYIMKITTGVSCKGIDPVMKP